MHLKGDLLIKVATPSHSSAQQHSRAFPHTHNFLQYPGAPETEEAERGSAGSIITHTSPCKLHCFMAQ